MTLSQSGIAQALATANGAFTKVTLTPTTTYTIDAEMALWNLMEKIRIYFEAKR